MRTLTQVWVFFVSLTLFLLLAGFQLAGRRGLLAAFLLSLALIYATLHRGLALFKKHLNARPWDGNDSTGFANTLYGLKREYGLSEVMLHYTSHPSPPLVWKNSPREGHVLVNHHLIDHLTPSEKKLLAHFLLAHLNERSFLMPRVLSIFEQGFWGVNHLLAPFVTFFTFMMRIPTQLLRADLKAMQKSEVSVFEMGYFLHKIHQFQFHKTKSLKGGEFFSTLTITNQSRWRSHGLPNLKKRLINVMGFEP
jgi:hypothetical protein